ncbi:MAG: hypothetical protein JSV88_01820 [Candidatus Aminicenantes bacterium]|nr:MAG: hypothetical protein JSV88_01820 [Candidatus Aminicenantes bacterium]
MMNDVREFKRLLEEIRWLDAQLQGKDFLLTWERSLKEVQQVLYTAEALKWLYENNISAKCFDSGLAILQTRNRITPVQTSWTAWNRLAFVLAANSLGLTVHEVGDDEGDIQPAYLSFLREADIIGVQYTSPGSGGEKEAAALSPLTRGPGIINLLCDLDYPIQAMADILVLKHHFGSLERLQDKKITVTWIYSPTYITPRSLPQGIVSLVTRFGMAVTLAHPGGFDLNPQVMEMAHKHAENSGGSFTTVHSPEQASRDADAVYSLNWPPATPIGKKTALEDWIYTGDSKTLSMETLHSAGWKSYITAAMILNNRFEKPAKLLGDLKKRNAKRLIF